MIRKGFQFGIGLLALSAWAGMLLASPARADVRLQDVRFADAAGALQVVLELSRATDHELFTLDDPHRIVIDLAATSEVASLALPPPSGPITALRTGERPDGSLRFVIETSAPLTASTTWSGAPGAYSQRLVVTLSDERARPLQPVRAAHAPADSGRDIVIAVVRRMLRPTAAAIS